MKSVSNEDYIKELRGQNAELKKQIKIQQEEIERIVEKRTQELIELIKTKDKFYRIIAHELRNPFNSILGLLELLLSNFRSYNPKEVEEFLNIIYSSTNISFELLVNLSEWLSVHSNKLSFQPRKINISTILTEAILTTELSAQQKQIEIINNISEEIFAIVDINMIGTIFRNLLNNAIKFSQNNGSIIVTALVKDEFVEISVKDSGIGIDKRSLQKIFELEGIDSTHGTAYEDGTGLGLLLCKELVEIEGGQIWVESIVGEGSEFKFTLPNHKSNP
jgi:signal transduction histidine kinase